MRCIICAGINAKKIYNDSNHSSFDTALFDKKPIINRIENPSEFKKRFAIRILFNLNGGAAYKNPMMLPMITKRSNSME
ncbi:MAG: hypothetical protein V1900_04170 [Candidatus Aenigmatarchaeota archaeon]